MGAKTLEGIWCTRGKCRCTNCSLHKANVRRIYPYGDVEYSVKSFYLKEGCLLLKIIRRGGGSYND